MAETRVPALTVSALLHGGLLALALLVLPKAKLPELIGQATPVTVVASAPEADVRPAVQAPEPAPAAAEEPAPAPLPPAPVERPAPPAPAPTPAPPPPAAKPAAPPPKPAVAPPKPPPTPPRAAASRPIAVARPTPNPELDLSKLAAGASTPARAKPQALDLGALASASAPRQNSASRSLDLDALTSPAPGGTRQAAGVRGPAKPETARAARPALGAATGLSADELGALRAKLIRLWSPNCGVEGAANVVARVRMRLAPDGSLAGPPELVDTAGEAGAAVVQAAGVRAVSAVARGAPYSEIPRERLKVLNDIVFKFDAKQACR